ncbi:hypothetical protein GCM10027286_17910 [Virgibacillus ainsalahensis]
MRGKAGDNLKGLPIANISGTRTLPLLLYRIRVWNLNVLKLNQIKEGYKWNGEILAQL